MSYVQMVLRLDAEQATLLKAIAKRTRVAQAKLLREAVSDLIEKYARGVDPVQAARRSQEEQAS
jgi:hypothetical protein